MWRSFFSLSCEDSCCIVFICGTLIHPNNKPEIEMTQTGLKAATQITVEAMLNQIGLLRKLMAIDSMPVELQEVRQLLRVLDAKLNKVTK